eukprot:4090424-Pleurochrysis_carterae.AAC.1
MRRRYGKPRTWSMAAKQKRRRNSHQHTAEVDVRTQNRRGHCERRHRRQRSNCQRNPRLGRTE